MTKALYPGSFDPIHNGHLDIVTTAARLFDEVVVAAMRNPSKSVPFFTDAERVALIEESTAHLDNVVVVEFAELVIDLAQRLEVDLVVKGLRGVADFDSEMQMAQMNRSVGGVDTMFLPAKSGDDFIASKYIREITKFGGDCSHLVPEPVAKLLLTKQGS
ncbi:MAG: pantetheine-phosphate adenylyltransferase [Actinomycetota bacterium]|nr:pantetheine-phosphate adenylyltransferase [Actinomycetota bacterium]